MTKRSRAEAELPYTYHPQIPYTFKERAGLNLSKRRKMSADVHERLAFKQETTLFRYCEGNLSFSSSNDDDCNYNRKKMSRDPMSHRIIEKRRRDRMNNCLADLSRLIPPEYLKKGRGRIEKTEIIEMAIKHMRHLQNVIANARYSENSDFSAPSPPEANRDQQTILNDPINVKHFRMGYVECLSEAMHYLVDVQGYFAGDSLCVQMINHLHKHCDQFLKGNTLNFQRRVAGEARTVATSPIALRPLSNSPVSSSTGVPSDDNLSTQTCDSSLATVVAAARQLEEGGRTEPIHFRSPKRYSDGSYRPKARLDNYSRCSESEGGDTESRSDVELQQCFALKCRTNENRKEEPGKSFLSSFESSGNFSSKSYVSGEEITSTDDSSYDTSSKDDRVKGPSQLREMLTSPATVGQMNGHVGKSSSDSKESSSTANSSDDSSIQGGHFKPCSLPQNLSFKSHLAVAENHEGNGDIAEGMHSDNHHMMYKFKNNIKQRFSKENRETAENELEMHAKRLKLEESPKPVEMMETDFRRKHRHASESDVADVDIGNRLSFGHKSNERPKRWDEPNVNIQNQNNSKFWPLSPYPSTSFNNLQQGAACMKPIGRQETPTMMSNSLNALTISDPTPGVPIFALHAKGSFYIPLTLDQASLAPFLPILGITKTDEEVEQNTLLHPVTISVNFQSQSTQPPSRAMSC